MKPLYPSILVLILLAATTMNARAQEENIADNVGSAEADGGIDSEIVRSVDEALKKLAGNRELQALQLLEEEKYPQALVLFRQAHDLDPKSAAITTNLGYAHFMLGNKTEAERFFLKALQMSPDRSQPYLNLAELRAQNGETLKRLKEAEKYLIKARELGGNADRVILFQARVAALLDKFKEAKAFYTTYLNDRKPTDKIRLEIGDFYRSFSKTEEALTWYRQIRRDRNLAIEAKQHIRRIEVDQLAQRFRWGSRSKSIPSQAKLLEKNGRMLVKQQKYGEAEQLFQKAISLAPGYSKAQVSLGDLLFQTGKASKAELAYLRALSIDSGNQKIYERLGRLYLAEPDGLGASQAALILSRALDLGPDRGELHFYLARALQLSGDPANALYHIDQYLGLGLEDSAKRKEALELRRTLNELLPRNPTEESKQKQNPKNKIGRDKNLASALSRARAFLARGEPDGALWELRSLSKRKRGKEVLNLEARILFAVGRFKEASTPLKSSLAMDGNQTAVVERLGAVLEKQGKIKGARKHLLRAENMGSLTAPFHLARIDAGGIKEKTSLFEDGLHIGDLLKSKNRLKRLLKQGSPPEYRHEAGELLKSISDRLNRILLAAIALASVAIVVLFILFSRVLGGKDLEALLKRHPEAGPEVQQVLLAIRHEVLKHNTMMLTGLVAAVQQGQDVTDQAAHITRSLLGSDEKSVLHRLKEYSNQLVKIGRTYGLRLNLDRKDPAISILKKGLKTLKETIPLLKKEKGSLGEGQRAHLLKRLNKVNRQLNVQGYDAVCDLLNKLELLKIEKSLFFSIWDRICKEPKFSKIPFAPLKTSFSLDFPLSVSIPKQAFEDILANLVRNAIQSSVEDGVSPVVIELGTDHELDPITGLEQILFLIRDQSNRKLTIEMLSGRNIKQGLGLTAQLVSKHHGSLDVLEGGKGWSKTVAFKLPRTTIRDQSRQT